MRMALLGLCVLIAICMVGALRAQESAVPDSQATPDLAALTKTLVQQYGPFDLQSETLQQKQSVGLLPFTEDHWLVGYRVEMNDPSGEKLDREFMCHTFFGSRMPKHAHHDEVRGIFSDGYTDEVRLPPGFGILFKAGEKAVWQPMFNNRDPQLAQASMKLSLDLIPAGKLPGGLRELETTFRSVQLPHLYHVPPGKKDVRDTIFLLPAVERIHVMGTHLHPYGVSIELINVTRNESVWKAVGTRDQDGRLVTMPVYRSAEGYAVEADDIFKLVAVYENPTAEPADAMAGVFILYAPKR